MIDTCLSKQTRSLVLLGRFELVTLALVQHVHVALADVDLATVLLQARQ